MPCCRYKAALGDVTLGFWAATEDRADRVLLTQATESVTAEQTGHQAPGC